MSEERSERAWNRNASGKSSTDCYITKRQREIRTMQWSSHLTVPMPTKAVNRLLTLSHTPEKCWHY